MEEVLSSNMLMFNRMFGLRNKLGSVNKGPDSSKNPKMSFDKSAGNKFNKEMVNSNATMTENMHKFNGTMEESLVYSADMYDKADSHPYVVSGISTDKGEITGYSCSTYSEDQTEMADSMQNLKKEYKMMLKHPHLKSGDSMEGYVMDYKLELEVGVVLENMSDVFEMCEYKEKNVEYFLKEVGNMKPVMSDEEVSKKLVDYAQKMVSLVHGK